MSLLTPYGGVWLHVTTLIILMITKSTISSPKYENKYCLDDNQFKPKSEFYDNLNTLFQSLLSNATSNPTGFYHTSIGTKSSVYGLFLCRGDQSIGECSECVSTAITDLQSGCPLILAKPPHLSQMGLIWYDQCMVRYSNHAMLGRMDNDPAFYFFDMSESQSRYKQSLGDQLRTLANESATTDRKTGKKYTTIQWSLSSSDPMYALAQCTPDLTETDCHQCLMTAIDRLPRKQTGLALLPSCNVRYDNHLFYSAGAKTPPSPNPSAGKKDTFVHGLVAIGIAVLVSIALALLIPKCFKRGGCARSTGPRQTSPDQANNVLNSFEMADGDDYPIESLQCSLDVLHAATNNFCNDNKIGEGGFGRVYKGTLPSGKHIAIKKLLRTSGKGEEEFKNEMKVVAKLQHRNLVRLLGFCLAGDERLLVFEFVLNKSLDDFIFDGEKGQQLNWSSRFKIIVGIARGLLYLHEDSRLRIIHRDLKPANILLDMEMNPKIADFGMARIFGTNQNHDSPNQSAGNVQQISGADQSHQSTKEVGGTLGYMAPEYAQTMRFSVKTDVYSFGVLVLEIISGKRNSTFHRFGLAKDLMTYAWNRWNADAPLDLMDTTLIDSYMSNEVIRCIHLALLCVQKDPNARPTMPNILHMLNVSSTSYGLPVPQSPASFESCKKDSKAYSGSNQLQSLSANEVSVDQEQITELYPR